MNCFIVLSPLSYLVRDLIENLPVVVRRRFLETFRRLGRDLPMRVIVVVGVVEIEFITAIHFLVSFLFLFTQLLETVI